MRKGTVLFYNLINKYGFIRPDGAKLRSENVHFHYNNGSARAGQPLLVPQKGDRISFREPKAGQKTAAGWEFDDVAKRLHSLTPAQLDRATQLLGENIEKCFIWNDGSQPRRLGLERFGVMITGGSLYGTFDQVLLWAWLYMGEHGYKNMRPLVPWADMPRYSLRYLLAGNWHPMNMPFYTQVQAKAFTKSLPAIYEKVAIRDLWGEKTNGTAPQPSAETLAKILAGCERRVFERWTTWIDPRDRARVVVARGQIDPLDSWIILDDLHQYSGQEVQKLRQCGIVASSKLVDA